MKWICQGLRLVVVSLLLAVGGIADAGAADSDLQREVAAVIEETANRWNSQNWVTVLELWDSDEPTPMYLAEEQKDWFIGWPALKAYFGSPAPFIDGIREEMSDIRVRLVAPDLAVAVWKLHFEMKVRGRPAIGEDIRVTGVFRRKPAGWRYIHYAEAPMTAPMYMQKLMERDVEPEFQRSLDLGKQNPRGKR